MFAHEKRKSLLILILFRSIALKFYEVWMKIFMETMYSGGNFSKITLKLQFTNQKLLSFTDTMDAF